MLRRRFFVPRDQIHQNAALLSSDQFHHLRHVLRLGRGDEVELFDGTGNAYVGIVEIAEGKARIESLREILATTARSPSLILATALIKSARFEWILEKGTELGVSEFIPLITKFTNVRIPEDKIAPRLQRWGRIIQEASKQCRRLTVPAIQRPMSLDDLLVSGNFVDCAKVLLSPNAQSIWPPDLPSADRVLICVGPEGGWEGAEIEAAAQSGYHLFGLGPRILRAETATLAAITLFQFHLSGCLADKNEQDATN